MNATDVKAHTTAARRLEYLSIAWTALEALGGIALGVTSGSVALLGFGGDSIVEVASSLLLLWRLSDHEKGSEREKTALRGVGVCFLALAGVVIFESVRNLISREAAQATFWSIGYAIACLVVMPLLARAKRRAGRQLQSEAMRADAKQSDLCAYLSAILLVGLTANHFFGWWWADPVAALIMVPIILKEGWEALCGETCQHCHCS